MKKYLQTRNTQTEETFYIDPNTGEVINWDNQTVYIQTEAQRQLARQYFDKLSKSKEINEECKKYGRFIWGVYNISQKSFPELKPSNITRLMYLATFISYDGYISDNKNNPLQKNKIFDIMGLSEREFRNFYKNLIDNKITYEKNDKVYINENIFKKGELSPRDLAVFSQDEKYLTRIYINGVRELYKKATARSHKSLSYIFQVLPYVNRDYNIVCHNPLETELNNIQKMTLGEFCDIIEYSKNNITQLAKTLFEPTFMVNKEPKTAMRYVLDRSLDKNTYSMFINPRVYYAGNKWNVVEVLGRF